MLFDSRDKSSDVATGGKSTLLPCRAYSTPLSLKLFLTGEAGSTGDDGATLREGGATNERGNATEGGSSSDRDVNPLEPFIAVDENRRLQGKEGYWGGGGSLTACVCVQL